jgi:hypothetical protein
MHKMYTSTTAIISRDNYLYPQHASILFSRTFVIKNMRALDIRVRCVAWVREYPFNCVKYNWLDQSLHDTA